MNEITETQHGIPCTDPFHVDGCTGAAGGDHELRTPVEVWCGDCDQPAVFASRNGSFCAKHGLEVAFARGFEEASFGRRIAPLGGIEQYQAEGR